MTYTAVITHPHDADAMPMWESSGHAEAADALQAAHAHIHGTQPDDRTVDEGEGVYGVWSAPTPSMRVATLVITPTADHHPRSGRRNLMVSGITRPAPSSPPTARPGSFTA